MVSIVIFLGVLIILSVLKSHEKEATKKLGKPIRWILVIEIIGIVLSVGEMVYRQWFYPTEIERPDQGEGNLIEEYSLEREGEKQDVEVEIEEKEYDKNQAEKYLEKAKAEIDNSFPGKNQSLDCITQNVSISDKYVDGKVKAEWTFSPSNIIDAEGKIYFEKIEDPTQGMLMQASCELTCGSYGEIYSFPFSVQVPDMNTAEGFQYYLQQSLDEMNQAIGDTVTLPGKINGERVTWRGINEHRGRIVSILGLVALIGIILGEKEERHREKKKQMEQMRADYADIVEKMALYIAAGIGIRQSFQRILAQYEKLGRKRPGFEEVRFICREMDSGVSEVQAYEHLGQRAIIPQYRKLSLLILQNIKRGTEGLAAAFEKEEVEVFQMRKNRIKTAGEEASTKLLFPMMGLLLMVLIVMIVPALMNINL